MKAIEDTAANFWTKSFEVLEAGYSKTTTKTITGEQVIAEIYNATSLIKNKKVLPNMGHYGEKDGEASKMTQEAAFFTSMWTTKMVLLTEENNITLPTTLKANLTAVDYEGFYNNLYYPVMGTLRIAERIYKEEVTKMEDFSDEELAFLNEVWTAGYKLDGA